MIAINLLPWRAKSREEDAQKRKLFLICISIFLLLWLISHIGFYWSAQHIDTHLADLQSQLTELTSQSRQKQLNPYLLLIGQVRSSQLELINFFKKGMLKIDWSDITSKKNRLSITGTMDSLLLLARFVDGYNKNNQAVPLIIVSVKNNGSAVQFSLHLVRAILPFLDQIKNDDDVT